MDLDKAFETYIIAKSNNIYPSHNIYTSLLSLTAGFGDQGMCKYTVYIENSM